MRSKLRYYEKKLNARPSVVFRKTKSKDELEKDFPELARLHQLRWESKNQPGSFSRREYIDFHKKAMKEMMKNGHLDLWFLCVERKPIAAVYNINYKNRIYFYQSGIDAKFDRAISPGVLLYNHCIKEAITRGAKEYDFLAMGKEDTYKKNWAPVSNHIADVYMMRPGFLKYVAASLIKLKLCYRALKAFRKTAKQAYYEEKNCERL